MNFTSKIWILIVSWRCKILPMDPPKFPSFDVFY